MKQECPTYLKTIEKSKALTATLSDTELENDSDNEDDGILNAFTAIVNPTEEIIEDVDEEKELVESKFEKMDEQNDIHTTYAKLYKVSEKHDKLYRSATKKLSEVELDKLRDRVRGTRTPTFAQSNWKRSRIRSRITRRGRSLFWRFLPMTIYLKWFLRRFNRRHRW